MKKLSLFIVFITSVFCLLWISGVPESLAHSSKPIRFRGDVRAFEEEKVTVGSDDTYWIMKLTATVETDSGDLYELMYTDWQPSANSPSNWRQFHIIPENSWWNFVGVDNHEFEALGQINVPAWLIAQNDNHPEDNNGPLHGRLVGVFDITEGKWEGHNIVGGQAHFNVTFAKAEYSEKGGCQNEPCNETVSGTVSGQIIVEE